MSFLLILIYHIEFANISEFSKHYQSPLQTTEEVLINIAHVVLRKENNRHFTALPTKILQAGIETDEIVER